MTDARETSSQASKSIDVRDDRNIEFWCAKLQRSEEDLRRAVAAVGVSALQVAEHLGLTEAALA